MSIRFQDIMDPARIVEVAQKGYRCHKCKVFYKSGKQGELVYHGKAEIPISFFAPNTSIGLRPMDK